MSSSGHSALLESHQELAEKANKIWREYSKYDYEYDDDDVDNDYANHDDNVGLLCSECTCSPNVGAVAHLNNVYKK